MALVVGDHHHHESAVRAVGTRRIGLAGHAAFETFSVLTRLPPPTRRTPAVVSHLLATNFPESRFLSSEAAAALMARLGDGTIAGGSIYDALVGAVAVEHRLVLVTRDRRAVDTYRAIGVDIELLSTTPPD
ncbi:MAG: type II toxin-antitoxin system VapC family toxin [Actinomycetota bacterium]|nr:type II toxin-antitoxin system VapC family toxin [Actinomycetota bacterium]